MTPTSPLAGLLTGLVDGAVVVALALLVAHLYARHLAGKPVRVHPVAEDLPAASCAPEAGTPALRKVA